MYFKKHHNIWTFEHECSNFSHVRRSLSMILVTFPDHQLFVLNTFLLLHFIIVMINFHNVEIFIFKHASTKVNLRFLI